LFVAEARGFAKQQRGFDTAGIIHTFDSAPLSVCRNLSWADGSGLPGFVKAVGEQIEYDRGREMEDKRVRALLAGLAVVVFAGVLGVGAWSWFSGGRALVGGEKSPLESVGNFGSVPDFSLTERSGQPLVLGDLRGKIWLANFIYTACQDTCPLQTAAMAKLQEELVGENRVRLVSISVDPERDTPEVLSAYAKRYDADPQRWLFLTGEPSAIYRLAREGFHLSASPAAAKGASREPLHSSRFVLVDGAAQIRGYYESRDPQALERLRHDLAVLLHQRNYG
jgi:protein SCO1/2